jgi:hypothetical protein
MIVVILRDKSKLVVPRKFISLLESIQEHHTRKYYNKDTNKQTYQKKKRENK